MADFGLHADLAGLSQVGGAVRYNADANVTAANTRSAWVQIVASTPANVHYLAPVPYGRDNGGNVMFDLGIGPAGAETVLVPDIPYASFGGVNPPTPFLLPVQVPAGSRLAVRASSTTTGTQSMGLYLYTASGMHNQANTPRIFSVGAGSSVGTATVLNSYVQLTASMPYSARAFQLFICSIGGAGNIELAHITLATGAAGAEQPFFYVEGAIQRGVSFAPHTVRVPVQCPAGVRLSVRAAGMFNGLNPAISLLGMT